MGSLLILPKLQSSPIHSPSPASGCGSCGSASLAEDAALDDALLALEDSGGGGAEAGDTGDAGAGDAGALEGGTFKSREVT